MAPRFLRSQKGSGWGAAGGAVEDKAVGGAVVPRSLAGRNSRETARNQTKKKDRPWAGPKGSQQASSLSKRERVTVVKKILKRSRKKTNSAGRSGVSKKLTKQRKSECLRGSHYHQPELSIQQPYKEDRFHGRLKKEKKSLHRGGGGVWAPEPERLSGGRKSYRKKGKRFKSEVSQIVWREYYQNATC